MRVLCIDDANKPAKIPDSEWIEKDKIYTVTNVAPMGLQPGKVGYKLKEVQLSMSSFPYEYYASERFAIIIDDKLQEAEVVAEEELSLI
jgi:hypothetical protein